MERLIIGGLRTAITRRATERGAAVPTPASPPAPQPRASTITWPPAGLPVLQIGRVSLPNGGTIALRDKSVQPPFTGTLRITNIHIESLVSEMAAAPYMMLTLLQKREDMHMIIESGQL